MDLDSDDWADVLPVPTGGATSIISCRRAGGTCWKRGGIPVGRLVWSASFGGMSLTWIVIESSRESWPVVDVSGSVRVGSGSFVVNVSRSVGGEVVVLVVVVVVFVIVLEVGLSSSITINGDTF